MHVLWHGRVAAVGTWGRRRDRTDQICVRHRHIIFKLRLLDFDFVGSNSAQLRKRHPDLRHRQRESNPDSLLPRTSNGRQVYSNGASEIILGKAIKQLNLPREEIVVMTKVRYESSHPLCVH
jgi:hypothetical protein